MPNIVNDNVPCCFVMQVLSEELSCNADEIMGLELNVCDTQPSCLGGGNNEFIFSGRLDNLASSYCALRSLVDSCKEPRDLANEQSIRMVALFDNEEVTAVQMQSCECLTKYVCNKSFHRLSTSSTLLILINKTDVTNKNKM